MVRYIASDIDLYDICLLIEETRAPVDRLAQMLGTYDRKIERKKERLREYGIHVISESQSGTIETRLVDEQAKPLGVRDAFARLDQAKSARFDPEPSKLSAVERADVIELYQEVVAGKRDWPDNYFRDESMRRERLRVILPFFVGEVFRGKVTEIKKKNLMRARLTTVFNERYNGSPYLLLREAYPWIKEWQLGGRKGLWVGRAGLARAKRAIRWLARDVMGYTDHDEPLRLTTQDFYENGLGSLLKERFGNSVYRALSCAYSGRFSREEFYSEMGRKWQKKPVVSSAADQPAQEVTICEW